MYQGHAVFPASGHMPVMLYPCGLFTLLGAHEDVIFKALSEYMVLQVIGNPTLSVQWVVVVGVFSCLNDYQVVVLLSPIHCFRVLRVILRGIP